MESRRAEANGLYVAAFCDRPRAPPVPKQKAGCPSTCEHDIFFGNLVNKLAELVYFVLLPKTFERTPEQVPADI